MRLELKGVDGLVAMFRPVPTEHRPDRGGGEENDQTPEEVEEITGEGPWIG